MIKLLFGILGGVLIASPSVACDCVRFDPSFPRFQKDLDAIEKFYPIAAQGIVQADGPYAWHFVPTREYRGPHKPFYRINLLSDCSLDPDQMKKLIGKSIFLLLSPGSGQDSASYEAQRCVNLLGGPVEAAIRTRFKGPCKRR